MSVQLPKGPRFAIDVECVASGTTHNDRTLAQISVVDEQLRLVLNVYVKPSVPVVSYLTPLTGITQEKLEKEGVSFDEAVAKLRAVVPKDAVLVGWAVQHDAEWCHIRQGRDYASLLDVQALYETYNPRFKSTTKFPLSHPVAVLLKPDFSGSPAVPSWRPTFGDGSQWLTSGALHDATYDAGVTLLLLQLYEAALATGSLPQMQSVLNATPIAPTFRKLNPYVDGVCMGNKKECRCQAPRIYN